MYEKKHLKSKQIIWPPVCMRMVHSAVVGKCLHDNLLAKPKIVSACYRTRYQHGREYLCKSLSGTRIKCVVCKSVQVYERKKKHKLNVSRMKRQWGYKKCNLHHTNWVIDSGRLYWHGFASFIEFDTGVNNATSVLVCLHPQKSYF